MSKAKKAKPVKFTFKKQHRNTGLFAIGHPHQDVDVKFNKKKFGYIHAANWSRKHWTVQYAVKDGESNPNCDWNWVMVREKFNDEQAARDWFQANAEKIAAEPLHFFDDED